MKSTPVVVNRRKLTNLKELEVDHGFVGSPINILTRNAAATGRLDVLASG